MITSLLRDWADGVNIVRMVTTDTLAVVGTPGYITAQATNIALINSATVQEPFTWLVSDVVLVYAADGWAFYSISPDFTSLNLLSNLATVNGLTALAGGGQTGATPLIEGVNRFTTVTTTGDSAILPLAVPGNRVTVINAGANSMNVFPAVGQSINAL